MNIESKGSNFSIAQNSTFLVLWLKNKVKIKLNSDFLYFSKLLYIIPMCHF